MGGTGTIKTGLLQAIEVRLNEIPELATVKRWEDIPADLEAMAKPILFFWEEEDRESWNRLTLGNLDFWMQVFFTLDPDDAPDYTAFTEAAEIVAGKIQNLLAAPGTLRAAGLIRVKPDRVVKARYNSEYGTLFLSYQLMYAHAAGNAFALNDS